MGFRKGEKLVLRKWRQIVGKGQTLQESSETWKCIWLCLEKF